MNSKEYRLTANFVLGQAVPVFDTLYFLLCQLDNRTRDKRIITKEIKRGKKTVIQHDIIPITIQEFSSYLNDCGYSLIINIITEDLRLIARDEVTHDWVMEYIKQYLEYFPEYEHIFDECNFNSNKYDREKDYGMHLILIKNAMQTCLEFGNGDSENVHNLIGYVANQAVQVLDYLKETTYEMAEKSVGSLDDILEAIEHGIGE